MYLVGHDNYLTAPVTSTIIYTIKVRKIHKM